LETIGFFLIFCKTVAGTAISTNTNNRQVGQALTVHDSKTHVVISKCWVAAAAKAREIAPPSGGDRWQGLFAQFKTMSRF